MYISFGFGDCNLAFGILLWDWCTDLRLSRIVSITVPTQESHLWSCLPGEQARQHHFINKEVSNNFPPIKTQLWISHFSTKKEKSPVVLGVGQTLLLKYSSSSLHAVLPNFAVSEGRGSSLELSVFSALPCRRMSPAALKRVLQSQQMKNHRPTQQNLARRRKASFLLHYSIAEVSK